MGFEIEEEDRALLEKLTPVVRGVRLELPEPVDCPRCLLKRRVSWRNDMNLYRAQCAMSGKQIVSMYRSDGGFRSVAAEEWWGDDWDAKQYGRDYDFDRGFFEQFAELLKEVPRMSLAIASSENSDYTNYNIWMKNCYLCFAGNGSEDCMYCYNAQDCRDCVDMLFSDDCELCYEGTGLSGCYQCFYSDHSVNCSDCWFVTDCIGSKDCIASSGLRNAQYCILNKQYTREEYERRKAEILKDLEAARKWWEIERAKLPQRESHNRQAEDCEGEYIVQSKNCKKCYIMAKGGEDCRYIFNGFPDFKDSMHCAWAGENSQLDYECIAGGSECERRYFTNVCFSGCSNVFYSDYCVGVKNVFGCSGLQKAEYCILNKQYSKEEYEELVPRIVQSMRERGEWGKFFPAEMSPFAYNESWAQILFPLEKEEALARGLQWFDGEDAVTTEAQEGARKCEVTGKPFKILEAEKKFYQRFGLPEPKKCFDQRHRERWALRKGFDGIF